MVYRNGASLCGSENLQVGGADEKDITSAKCRYRATSAEYARFSKAMDLPQQRERVTIDGLGDVRKTLVVNSSSKKTKRKSLYPYKKIKNYKWNAPYNIEQAKKRIEKYSLESRIQAVRDKIKKYGIKEEYIHEAGKAIMDEISIAYDISDKNMGRYLELKKAFEENINNNNTDTLYNEICSLNVIENIPEMHALQLKSILSRIRSMGHSKNSSLDIYSNLTGEERAIQSVLDAYSYLPEDWIKTSLQAGRYVIKYKSRGCYNASIRLLYTDYTLGTSIHEFVHRMECYRKHLLNIEEIFYRRRTKGELLVNLKDIYPKSKYKDYEITRVDSFINPYMGKSYNGALYELLTMGIQDAYTLPKILWQDYDMTTWIYGVLALL